MNKKYRTILKVSIPQENNRDFPVDNFKMNKMASFKILSHEDTMEMNIYLSFS